MKKTIGLWKFCNTYYFFPLFTTGINLGYVTESGVYFSYSNDDALNDIYFSKEIILFTNEAH